MSPASAGEQRGEAQPQGLLPTLSVPKGGGAIRGIGEKFSTNPATGTGALCIPLATSTGRVGFQLGLELRYDSGSGNGPFGLGWQLSTPSITRKTDKGLPRYHDGSGEPPDVFILSGGEDLVPVPFVLPDGTQTPEGTATENGANHHIHRYQPRTEGLFARIERWTNSASGDVHWRVYTRDNVLSVYGRSPSACIAAPETPSRVFSWLIEETRDDRGNVVRYSYKAEDGAGVVPTSTSEANRFARQPDGSLVFHATAQRYLKRIQYGNRAMVLDRTRPVPTGNDDYLFEVVFDYGEHVAPADALATEAAEPDTTTSWSARQDPFSTCRSGFEVRTYRLCRRALMFHRFAELGPSPCLVRSTDFEYDEGPVATYLKSVTHAGYIRNRNPAGTFTGKYTRAFLPSLDLGYVKPEIHDELRVVAGESLEGIHSGVGTSGAQWVDIDGEGIPGVLIPTERAWLYKSNLGDGTLAPPALMRSLPAPSEISGTQQLTDLGGDGNLDLVSYAPPLAGYFERTLEQDWAPFVALRNLPNIDWNDPNLRFIDLDGDGFPDVLVTEHDAFVWYRSRAKEGFEPRAFVTKAKDELKGPAIVFADGSETIQLADMSGDGLVDIVRVRNFEVCYWPNLGYGRFGRKVTLGHGPHFDAPDQFDPKRVRFADIDGSGTSDIIYLGRDGVRVYANQSGNSLAPAVTLASLPPVHSLASLSVVDLLGQGTACLVWSSPLSGERPLAYVDLMGGKKPHVLNRIVNNLGAETRIAYASSIRFSLQDKAQGKPWLTRLPFPVHVIERIERYDYVANSKFVTRFAYHHGYFDGYEREFRGFARVEQWDTESFGGEKGKGLFPDIPHKVDAVGDDLILPPIRTTTWFHTGAWLDRERLELALAKEYYNQDPQAPLLPDTTLPIGLSTREEREATRALRGQILRQEVYAEDGTTQAAHPYTASERDYEVRLLHHATEHSQAVFFVHPRHTISLNYERNPLDPRTQHEIVIEADDFGNVTQSAAVGYPRRSGGEPEQRRLWVTHTSRSFANRPDESDWYRVGVPLETTTSELMGLAPPAQGAFTAEHLKARAASATAIAYEVRATTGIEERRGVERSRNRYYSDNLVPLPFGQVESRALPFESYRQAFTPGLLTQEYGARVSTEMATGEGRYVLQDGAWWAPSGHTVFDAAKFYLPVEAVDPFGQHHHVRYDGYFLLVQEADDPLQNRITSTNDYRVLAPVLLTDPNLNRVAVEIDPLGMVVKTAVMGKAGAGEGDTLDDPTTRINYDVLRWKNSSGTQPVFVHAMARERHGSGNPRWQETYSYSDGFGREVMKKVQAEPGEVPILDSAGRLLHNPDGTPRTRHEGNRWVGTGRTVFDNKGNPIKKYEPFFSATFEYESEKALVEWGVTPILRYDPLGRLIRTDQPNGTHARIAFDAWKQETWDENDTVAGTPWLARKQAGNPREQRCANLALAHAGTPTVAYLDSLGRVFLTVADNGSAGLRKTRFELDVEGNQTSVTDARGNVVLRQVFDMIARPVRVIRADAGAWDTANKRRAVPVKTDPDGARTLLDAANKPVRAWLDRDFSVRPKYDELQRPTHIFVRDGGGNEQLVEFTVYGESLPLAASQARNLRTRVCQGYDGAGVHENVRVDFKGNLLESARRLAKLGPVLGAPANWDPYRPDWKLLDGLASVSAIEVAANPLLDGPHRVTASYDALNRVASRRTPDNSETRPSYNEANLLENVEVRIRGSTTWTTFIASVDYNARGQRISVEDGSNPAAVGPATSTSYDYDDETFRLTRKHTVRKSDGLVLQDLTYEHDPVGNIVQVIDRVSFGRAANAPVVASEANVLQRLLAGYGDAAFVYDALYQLVEARGRHHPGQQPDDRDAVLARFTHPNDPGGLAAYVETYDYDAVGNILTMANRTLDGGSISWTRLYAYAPNNNRLIGTSAPADPPGTLSATYDHDEAGNMVRMPHLPQLQWDYANRLKSVKKQVQLGKGPPNDVYFTYDSSGERVRKVYEHGNIVEERIYFSGYEIYRKRTPGSAAPDLERHTLHVMDDRRRVALVETKTVDTGTAPFVATTRQRFQIENHLGSSAMEVDETGAVIEYEEYYPFGATSFRAANAATDVSSKRYRYTGHERDEVTGLYYCRARYYLAWLGKWTSPDPAGLVDGSNLYEYVSNNPIVYKDPNGLQQVGNDLAPRNPLSYSSFESFVHGYQEAAQASISPAELRSIWDRAQPTPRPDSPRADQSETSGTSTLPQTAGSGAVAMWDTAQRSRYLSMAHANSAEAVQGIQQARVVGSVAEAEEIARQVSAARNELRTTTQLRLSPGGRMMSEALEQPREFSQLVQRYQAQNAFDTYEEVARAAGRSRGSLQTLTRVGRVAGPLATVAGVGIGVYNVVEAPPEEQPRVAAQESGGVLGGAGGATLGVAGGTAAATGIAAVLGLGSGPPGWLVLGLGLLGGGAGGYYGSAGGRAAGGALYDSAQLRDYQRSQEMNQFYSDPYVIMGMGGP
jgi:RHS repeat-associated protein